MKHQLIIAIDGPSASGKSTTARAVANALGWQYLDTGAMYRAIGLAMLGEGVDPADELAVCGCLSKYNVDLGSGDRQTVLLNGEDVSRQIRGMDVAHAASKVATIGCVREMLVDAQRLIGSSRPSVLEGRDTGTVVFPRAGLKIYLDASARQRAKRRLIDLGDDSVSLTEMMREIEIRDERDRNRRHSPLIMAEDAVIVNTGNLTVQQQVERVLNLAQERFGEVL